MDIKITPYTVLRCLLFMIAFLLLANVVGIICRFYLASGYIYGLVPLFNFDSELNIPTLYSSLALILSSTLLITISLTHRKNNTPYLGWLGLGFIFIFLAIDEVAVLHEALIEPVRQQFNASGLLFYSWVIPYGIASIALLIIYKNFLTNLPRRTMTLFLMSGAMFVFGAIGLEMVGGYQAERNGVDNISYSIITTCEELLEMLGVAVFIYALLEYIASQFTHLTINVTATEIRANDAVKLTEQAH